MLKLLTDILQKKEKAVKSKLTPCFKLVLREGFMKEIMRLKGWKTYEDVGRALGFTRAYIQMIDKRRVQVGPEFICRLAMAMGNIKEGWNIPFEIVQHGIIDDNHPLNNSLKHDGKMPYRRYSPAAELRKKDYPVEVKDS